MANAALPMIFKFQGEKGERKRGKRKKKVPIKYHGQITRQRVNPDNRENYRQ